MHEGLTPDGGEHRRAIGGERLATSADPEVIGAGLEYRSKTLQHIALHEITSVTHSLTLSIDRIGEGSGRFLSELVADAGRQGRVDSAIDGGLQCALALMLNLV